MLGKSFLNILWPGARMKSANVASAQNVHKACPHEIFTPRLRNVHNTCPHEIFTPRFRTTLLAPSVRKNKCHTFPHNLIIQTWHPHQRLTPHVRTKSSHFVFAQSSPIECSQNIATQSVHTNSSDPIAARNIHTTSPHSVAILAQGCGHGSAFGCKVLGSKV